MKLDPRKWNWDDITCKLGSHGETETHTQGIADEYGYRKCKNCGTEFGHWDYT